MTTRLMQGAPLETFDAQLDLERDLQDAASRHPDYVERVSAFLAKRTRTAA